MQFETFELTQTQRLILEQSDVGGNRCVAFRLKGNLDEERLRRAVEQVVGRCPPFAYRFLKVEGALKLFANAEVHEACLLYTSRCVSETGPRVCVGYRPSIREY